jgi:hypothetical protein
MAEQGVTTEEVGALRKIESGLHLNKNAFGEPLSIDEQRILKKTKHALMGRMADRHTEGDPFKLNDMLSKKMGRG